MPRNPKPALTLSFWQPLLLAILCGLMITACGSRDDEEDRRPASEIYAEAKTALDSGNWTKAIRVYKSLQTLYPFGRYTEQAQLELAYAYYKNREPEKATATLDRFLKTYPTHPSVDYAYYLKGLTNYEQNIGWLQRVFPARVRDRDQQSARQAFNDFSELLRRFPDSRYAPDARQRMVFLRNAMAGYEVEVAEYYLRRKANVAAVNRARFVVETYQQAPQTGDALAVMHEAYTRLDQPELAEDAMRVLELNYPEHPYLTGQRDGEGFLRRLWPFD